MGIQAAFQLYQYQNLQVQQAENPRALCKLQPLLKALLKVSHCGKVKYRPLKQSLQVQQQTFGLELFSYHWRNENKSHLPGIAADALGVVLNHWRRVCTSAASWAKFIAKLDEAEASDMEALKQLMVAEKGRNLAMEEKQVAKRQLKAHASEASGVSLTSAGFPRMLESPLAPGAHCEEESEEPATPSLGSCDKAALVESPPPCLKGDWREKAMKKPAAAKRPASASPAKGLKKGKGAKEDPKHGTAKVLIHQASLSIGGGHNQAYIQHVPGPGRNKRLIVACTLSQAARTTKTHRELVELLLPACKVPGACKENVLAARDKLFMEFAK